MSFYRLLAGLLLLLGSEFGFAQSTVGELLDAGGHQVEKIDLISLLSGKTWDTGLRGEPVRTQYGVDGTFIQTVRLNNSLLGGQNAGHFGDWAVNDAGQECQFRKDQRGGGAHRCRYWFALGDKYFTVDDDPKERSCKLHRRFEEI
jgi:hypothetical protein